MAGVQDPAVQRRRLRGELRKARTGSGETQKDVADALDWSTSKLIRIENGSVGITPTDLRALLGHYGIKDKRRVDQLVEMARASRKQAAWAEYRSILSRDFLRYLDYEAAASLLRQFEPQLVPGLLQTEEYARAILRDAYGNPADLIDKQWDIRQERQELLERKNAPEMFFIVDEAVLQRVVGGSGVMRRQLEHLAETAGRPHINLQVVPFAAGAQPGLRGPFTILEFTEPNDEDLLFVENTRGDYTTRDDQVEVGSYIETFFSLEEIASPKEEFQDVVSKIIANYPDHGVTLARGASGRNNV